MSCLFCTVFVYSWLVRKHDDTHNVLYHIWLVTAIKHVCFSDVFTQCFALGHENMTLHICEVTSSP